MNQQKYRQIQIALENAEERAEEAEHGLLRLNTKLRGRPGIMTSSTQPINGDIGGKSLARSATQAHF